MGEQNWLELLNSQTWLKQVQATNQYTEKFGQSILPQIIYAFCDSSFLSQNNYVETLIRLQEIFYLYKNETEDEITDEELIHLEQKFLGAFDRNYVISILEKYNSEYRNMVENICGIVLINIIGHVAIKKPFNGTGFLYEEYLQLSKVFAGKSISDIEHVVKELIKKIVSQFFENDMDMLKYLCYETSNIAVRIFTANQHGQLSKVFVS